MNVILLFVLLLLITKDVITAKIVNPSGEVVVDITKEMISVNFAQGKYHELFLNRGDVIIFSTSKNFVIGCPLFSPCIRRVYQFKDQSHFNSCDKTNDQGSYLPNSYFKIPNEAQIGDNYFFGSLDYGNQCLTNQVKLQVIIASNENSTTSSDSEVESLLPEGIDQGSSLMSFGVILTGSIASIILASFGAIIYIRVKRNRHQEKNFDMLGTNNNSTGLGSASSSGGIGFSSRELSIYKSLPIVNKQPRKGSDVSSGSSTIGASPQQTKSQQQHPMLMTQDLIIVDCDSETGNNNSSLEDLFGPLDAIPEHKSLSLRVRNSARAFILSMIGQYQSSFDQNNNQQRFPPADDGSLEIKIHQFYAQNDPTKLEEIEDFLAERRHSLRKPETLEKFNSYLKKTYGKDLNTLIADQEEKQRKVTLTLTPAMSRTLAALSLSSSSSKNLSIPSYEDPSKISQMDNHNNKTERLSYEIDI